jgi:hypothetical protein
MDCSTYCCTSRASESRGSSLTLGENIVNTQSIERLSVVVWLAIAAWLGFLVFFSRRFREAHTLRAILWAAFILFTFAWIPVQYVVAVPGSFGFVEGLVALPFDDGSERFHGVARPPFSMIVAGCIALTSLSLAALGSFWWMSKSQKKNA